LQCSYAAEEIGRKEGESVWSSESVRESAACKKHHSHLSVPVRKRAITLSKTDTRSDTNTENMILKKEMFIHFVKGSTLKSTYRQNFSCCFVLVWYEGVSKSFRTGPLERELQRIQLSATRYILWVSLVSFATITYVLFLKECLLL